MLCIVTPRLELVAAEPAIAVAEAASVQGWCAPLGVEPPGSWPPPLHDARALHWFAMAVSRDPGGLGWYTWYVVRRTGRTLIGQAGFEGRPDARGRVEIGYSLLPPFQGAGYGTELVRALTAWAFSHAAVTRVVANTYPELVASVRILEKNGFAFAGRADERGAIRFELRREVFEGRRARNAEGGVRNADRRANSEVGMRKMRS